MPFRIEINGMKVEVDTAAELNEIISMNEITFTSTQHHNPEPTSVKPKLEVKSEGSITSTELASKLTQLKGTAAADILFFLFEQENHVCTDTDLREFLGGEKVSLAPHLANLSKCLKNAGLDKSTVYQKKTQRKPKGKLVNWYRLEPCAVEAIKTIDDFNEPPEEDYFFPMPPEDF